MENYKSERTIFRIGDKVYWMKYDYTELYFGIINEYPNEHGRGYGVLESKQGHIHYVGEDELSFTEWSREKGGFCQIRPIVHNKGDVVFAWDNERNIEDKSCIYGAIQDFTSDGRVIINFGAFNHYSSEPPFK